MILNNGNPKKTEAQEYRELREHEEAKQRAKVMYEWKKENMGR